jgi:hypothetical protein
MSPHAIDPPVPVVDLTKLGVPDAVQRESVTLEWSRVCSASQRKSDVSDLRHVIYWRKSRIRDLRCAALRPGHSHRPSTAAP